jgi:hypothetical protein
MEFEMGTSENLILSCLMEPAEILCLPFLSYLIALKSP